MARTLINIPKTVKKGDAFEIKIILSHPMETGFRVNESGRPFPRHIIKNFLCTYLGDEIFRAEMFPAISANPYFSFFAVADATGPIAFSWTDDRGAVEMETVLLSVE